MANKNITDLASATTASPTDVILGRIGADTEDKKIPISVLSDGQYNTIGRGIKIKEGANAKAGVVTLAAGTATVANTSVTANSRIKLTPQSLGTITRPAALGVSARTVGTSFTIMSGDVTDTSVVYWEINENT